MIKVPAQLGFQPSSQIALPSCPLFRWAWEDGFGLLFVEPARLATWEWCAILFLFMSPAGCPIGLCFHPHRRQPAGVCLEQWVAILWRCLETGRSGCTISGGWGGLQIIVLVDEAQNGEGRRLVFLPDLEVGRGP